MLDLHYNDWVNELRKIIDDTYDISVSDFCNPRNLPKYYKSGYSPIEAFEELDEIYIDHIQK